MRICLLILLVFAHQGFANDSEFISRRLMLASNCVQLIESNLVPLKAELSRHIAECTNIDNVAESRFLLATILTESSETNDIMHAISLSTAITQSSTQQWHRALGHFTLAHAYGCNRNFGQQISIASNAMSMFATNVMHQSDDQLLKYLRSSGENFSYFDGLRCMIVQGFCGKGQFENAKSFVALIEHGELRAIMQQAIDFHCR